MARAPSTTWVSPGGSTGITQTIKVYDSGRGSRALQAAYKPRRGGTGVRRVLAAGGHQVFRPQIGGPLRFEVTIQGANVVSQHADAYQQMIGPFIWTIQNITGMYATAVAKSIVLGSQIWESGDTYHSIHHIMETQAFGSYGSITTEIGPTTFYAPFIEYGMGGHTHIGPRPFMTDTFFRIVPNWLHVFEELAKIGKTGARGGFSTNPYSGELNAMMRRWRQYLYSLEKEIGDLVPIGLPLSIGQHLRSAMINTARSLGDIQSILGRTVAQRFTRRLTGRVTGRLIGIGANTVFASTEYTARISGGERIYNRFAGRAMNNFARGNSFTRGLGA